MLWQKSTKKKWQPSGCRAAEYLKSEILRFTNKSGFRLTLPHCPKGVKKQYDKAEIEQPYWLFKKIM